MNGRIKQFSDQADLYARSDNSSMLFENYKKRYTEKFAELIVQEHLRLMQQEWYDLNNTVLEPGLDSARDVGMRVGQKSEVIILMNKVRKHFGVEE